MKKRYETPTAEAVLIESGDMLSTSGTFSDPDIITGGWVEI